ncbi:flavodoxin family protein [Desulfoluna spongiiphila]|uniref:flavodoxin family protein n=1 Tax=Desulfoluna spongiiphila TaxID=419481 RepID=UPI00125B3157|nr:flavodoxin family protein [Desulfoluna spongiiphila]VVS90885.1 nadph-dependent fmn reductase-like [Desulfoluna spongiiphila]
MKVLGVSGSPIKNSNTDRAVHALLAATGLDTEFVKLSDYTVEPCRACLGCVKTNVCVVKDDGVALAQKARECDAIVIAGFTPYSTLDSRTKAFIERMYPLRHRNNLMAGKLGAVVMTSAVPHDAPGAPPVCDMGIQAVTNYMQEEGIEFVGAVKITGNVPCVRCGFGDECRKSGITMIYGPEATVDSVGIKSFEKQPLSFESAEDLGREIARLLTKGVES